VPACDLTENIYMVTIPSLLGVGEINKQRIYFYVIILLLLALGLAPVPRLGFIEKSFAVESFYVGVYWDHECTKEVTSIEWGELAPGATSSVNIFVRNEELNSQCFLSLQTKDMSPPEAAKHISLHWDFDNRNLDLDEIVQVTLTLKVAQNIIGITDFNFTIIIFGTEYIVGDLNHDGIVNIFDVVRLARAYGSTPSDIRWNPEADLNSDNVVNIFDSVLIDQNYGATSS